MEEDEIRGTAVISQFIGGVITIMIMLFISVLVFKYIEIKQVDERQLYIEQNHSEIK